MKKDYSLDLIRLALKDYFCDIEEDGNGNVVIKTNKMFSDRIIDILLEYFDEVSINRLTLSDSEINFNNIVVHTKNINTNHNLIENPISITTKPIKPNISTSLQKSALTSLATYQGSGCYGIHGSRSNRWLD